MSQSVTVTSQLNKIKAVWSTDDVLCFTSVCTWKWVQKKHHWGGTNQFSTAHPLFSFVLHKLTDLPCAEFFSPIIISSGIDQIFIIHINVLWIEAKAQGPRFSFSCFFYLASLGWVAPKRIKLSLELILDLLIWVLF